MLLDSLKKTLPLSVDDYGRIIAASKVVRIPKGESLHVFANKGFKGGFLLKGCLRAYSTNESGKECSNFFVGENEFLGFWEPMFDSASSGIQALTSSECLSLDPEFLETDPYLVKLKKCLLERSFETVQKRLSSLLLERPEQRYEEFLDNHSALLKYIPDYYIASYIGVSSVHLSRIKKAVLAA